MTSGSDPRTSVPLRLTLQRAALFAAGGVAYFLGFAGFGIWPLALVSMVPVFAALELEPRTVRPARGRRIVAWGFFYGLILNFGGYYWLVGTLETFSGFPTFLCILFAAVLCLYQGGQLALFCWLWDRMRERAVSRVLAAVVAVAAAETLYPLLFQHFLAGSFHGLPRVIQIADLGGPILVSMLAAATSAAVYELAIERHRTKRWAWRPAAIVAAAWAATLGYGTYRLAEVDARAAAAPRLRVGLVQVNVDSFAKREDPREGVLRHIDQSLELEREGQLDLLVWPESAYMFVLPEAVTNVRRHVLGPDIHTPVLFGGLSRRSVDGHERHFNTAFLADANGNLSGTYDKTYLLAFGEYLPFGDTFPQLYEISRNSGRFTPGSHLRPLRLGEYRLSALICYEDILPWFVRSAVREGDPHLLVNITNDSWFGDTHEPWIHLALAQFRSVEHHRALVRATNSGVSAIVDPAGRLVSTSRVFERDNVYGEVALLTGATLYTYLGNWPGWLSVALAVFFLVRRRAAQPTPPPRSE